MKRAPKVWDGTLHRDIGVEICSVNEEERWVDVVASTEEVDSHNDIVEQDFKLRRYKLNPVVLFNHNKFDGGGYGIGGTVRPEDLLPIGRSSNVEVKNNKLRARLHFASAEARPLAEQIFQLFKEKVISAVSIGFRPGEALEENRNGRRGWRFKKNELFEISVVPMGSNASAVARSAEIEWENEQLRRMATKTQDESMDIEEAMAANAVLQEKLSVALKGTETSETARIAVEEELRVERATLAETKKTLDGYRERADVAEKTVREQIVERAVGDKILPAEREQYLKLAEDLGVDRVKQLLEQRPSLNVTQPLEKQNTQLGDRAGDDVSGEIAREAGKAS